MKPFHYLDDPRRNAASSPGRAPAGVREPFVPFDLARPQIVEADDSGKLFDYLHMLLRHKWTVGVFAFVGLAFALLVSLPQKSIYRAQVAVEIQDPNENFLSRGFDNAAQSGNDAAETFFQTQMRLLRSESLLDRVATKLNLNNADREPTSKPSLWRSLLRLPDTSAIPAREKMLRGLSQNLTVRVSGQTRVVEVLYESPNPALAAEFANTLVSEFIDQSQEMRWKSAQRAGEWLTRQLAEMKIKLEKAEAQLQVKAKASGMAFEAGKDSIDDARLRQLEDELSKTQVEKLTKQSKLELAQQVGPDSIPEVLDDPTIREYAIKLTDLRRQSAELNSNLMPAHYRVQEVERQIDAMKGALEKARSNMLDRIRNEYDAVVRHEELLEAACAAQMRRVANQSTNAVEYNMLKHEVDTSRQLYELLLQRVKEAGVASAMRASNVLVVDPARKPMFPYKPNFLMNSVIGMAGGLFLGIGFVFFREQSNQSFRDRGELSLQLNLPELGAIPEVRARFLQVNSNSRKPLVVDVGGIKSPTSEHLELATWNRNSSLIAESFRATLPSILFNDASGARPRVIVVTSPNPAEGKTTVATNLAIAISEITQRVLVIDGDLRKQRIHRIFGIENKAGLADLLGSNESLSIAQVEDVVQSTEIAGLYVLPGGGERPDQANLFYSRRLPELLGILRHRFDTVIIDSPPVLQIPDGRLIARFADGLILVVRAGRTARESAILAQQRLTEDGSRVLGTILNSWNPGNANRYVYSSRS
jgi:succinoglycan biosynthesis transport protein ExoP